MSFKDAVLGKMPEKRRAKAEKASGPARRVMCAMAERFAKHKIEEATGQKLVGTIDWSKWIDLLVKIMPLILQILALFGV